MRQHRVYLGTGGAAIKILDLANGEARDSTLNDLYQLGRLVDALDNIHFFLRPCIPTDISELAYDVNVFYACLKANQERLIDRYEPYKKLARMGRWLLDKPELCDYIEEQYFFDLVSWYHIAWMGETVKLTNSVIQSYTNKTDSFDSILKE